MAKDNARKNGRNSGIRRAGAIVSRAEWFSLGSLLGLGRMGGWTRVLSGALVAAVCSPALAGPEGAQVVRGNVTISRDGAQTLIRAGNNSIINYRSFNIGSNESVRFVQPNANARVLNRINSAAPTKIDGGLFANGRVYIVNPAGVLFGNGARVNVGGLYAAAGRISDKDFVRGVNNFTNMHGEVVNQGTITANFVGLLGKHAMNMGTIVAPQGTVVMGAGEDVLVGERSGNIFVRLKGAANTGSSGTTGAGVENTGIVNAQGGQVIMGAGDIYAMAVRTSGSVTARNVTVQAQGKGAVQVSGDIDAKGPRGTGGNVDVLGKQISLINARIDASGDNGGGTVHIGGDYQGQGARPHADTVYVSADSDINVSANATGKGGTAIVWSDGFTQFYGSASARGGAQGGDGGLIETSSHETVDLNPAKIDAAGGLNGKGGNWLIDPREVDITTTDAHTTTAGVNPVVITPDNIGAAGVHSTVDFNTIQLSLNTGTSVTIKTTQTSRADAGDIDIQHSISKTAGGDATLTLLAQNNITLEAGNSISATTGKLSVSLQANQLDGGDAASGTGNVVLNGSINTNGGTFSSSGVNFTSAAAGTINTSAAATGTITLNHTGTANIGGAMTAGGAVSLTGATGITLNAGVTATNANITFVNNTTVGTTGLTVASGTGAITFTGSLAMSANSLTLTDDALNFNGGANSVTGTGTLTLQPSADSVSIGTAGGVGTLQVSATDLAAVADGFGQIVIGRTAGTGTITLGAATFNDPVVIRSPGGTIDVTGALTGAGNASFTFFGPTILRNDIVTAGQLILITGNVLLANNIRLDTTTAGVFAAGANISITGTVDGTPLPGVEGLTLRAGTAGDISLGGIVGGGTPLGDFQITSAHAVGALAIHATTITQLAGTGTAAYAGVLDATAAGGINLTGTSFTLTGGASTIATGAFNLTNSGLSTISTTALNLGGAFTQTGAGAITLSTNITTTGDAVSFASPVTLGNNATIDTTSTAATGAGITFSSTINATNPGIEGLTLNSGTAGNISLGAAGGTTRLGELTFTNANNVTTGAITAFGIQQLAGGGTTQVNGAINTTGSVNLTGNVINLTSTVTTTGSGILFIVNSGQLTLGGTMSIDGGLVQSGGGPVAVNAGISTTNDNIGFTNNVTVGASGLTFNAGSAIVAFSGSLTLGANAITLTGNEINFNNGANSVTGTSTLTLQPGVDGTAVTVGSATDTGAGVLDLTTADLAALANGFTGITIGRTTGSQAISISASTFRDPVLFRSPGGGTITVAGNLAGATGSDASITITSAAASQIHLNANVTTDGRAIQLNGPVLLGATANLDSTNAGATLTGANIGVTGAIDATTASTQGLTLRAGTAGDIALGGITGTTRLGAFTITSALDVSTLAVSATTITQTAGGGTSTFGNLNTSAAGGINLTGGAFTLAGATTTTGGTFTVANTGALTIGTAALTLDGAFNQTGAGTVALNQGITTTNDSITFAGNVTAGAGVTSLDAGTGTVSFAGTLALGANPFTIGGNTIAFNGGPGSVTGTNVITLQPATNGTTIGIAGGTGVLQISAGTLSALTDGFSQIIIGRSAGTGAIAIGGAVSFSDPVLIRTPTGSITVGGNISGTGNASVTLTGATTLGANIVTAGQAIQINGALTVNGTHTLDTTNTVPAGAAIGITGTVNGTTAGVDELDLASGTAGDITLGGAIGATTRLGVFDIVSVRNVTTGAITADEITQDAGTGTTTFGGLLTARAAGINLTGAAFAVNGGASTTAGGGMTVANTGTLTIANTAVSLDGAFNQTGAGGVSIGAAITTTNDAITLTGPVTVGGSVGSLDAGTSTITINSTLALGANNFTLSANSLTFGGGAASVTGTGSITLEPGAPGVSIGIGGGAGTFAPDLTALADGFSQIVIGRADGNGAITINAITFNDPVLIRTPLAGGSITVNGQITGADNASITLTGSGSTTTLNADIVTAGTAIQINDSVILGTSVTLDSTNAGGSAGANVGITGTVNGTTAATESLTLRAGTGDIALGGAVGGTIRLDGLTVVSADDFTAAAVAARSLLQSAGTGTTSFSGLVDASVSGVNITTNAITFSAGVTTAGGGGVTLVNTGLLTISGAAWTLDGAFSQTGGGAVHLGSNITTTNDAVTFLNNVTLTAASTINTGVGAGDITFSGTTDGTFALTLDAGTGLVHFAGNVGATTPLGILTVGNSGGVTFDGTVDAASVGITSTGAVLFSGDVLAAGGFTSVGTTFQNDGSITTTNSALTLSHGSTVTINGNISSGTGAMVLRSGFSGTGNLLFGPGVNISADSILLRAGSGIGTASIDALTNTPNFLGSAGGATSPLSFTFRQDAAVNGAMLPATTQFGAGIAGMSYTVAANNGVLTVDDATKIDGSALTLTGAPAGVTGILVNVDLSLASFHATTGATLSNNITTTAGDITLTGAARTLNSIELNAGTGQVSFVSTLAADGAALTLTGTEMNIGGAVTPGAAGTLLIQTTDPAKDIYLGGTGTEGSGDMHLLSAEIAELGDGFSAITIGRTNMSGTIHVNSSVLFNDALTLSSSTMDLGADLLTSGASVTVIGNAVLTGNARIDTTNNGAVAAGAGIAMQGTINADVAANNRTLALVGGTGGAVALSGVTGNTQRLSTFSASGGTVVVHDVSTLGSQTYTGTAVVLNGNLDLNTGGAITINGPLTIFADTTIHNVGSAAGDNIVTGAIDSNGSPHDLTLDAGAAGQVAVGAIGTVVGVHNLTMTGGGGTSVVSATTSGFQSYNSPVTVFGNLSGTSISTTGPLVLGASAVLTGNTSVSLGGTVSSQAGAFNNLTIISPTTIITGDIGAVAGTELGTLTTDLGGLLNIHSAVIKTSGNQTYGDATTVFADLVMTSTAGDISFLSTLNSDTTARALTVNAGPGNSVFFTNTVGGIAPFATLTTSGGATQVGANVTTSGAQTYSGPVVLTADVTFNGVGLSFASTINSDATARALNLNANTGDVSVLGAIGGSSPLSALTVAGTNVHLVGATTTGAQSITGALTLGGDLTSTVSGSIDITGTLDLSTDPTIATAGGASDHITITGAINSPTQALDLVLNAGLGNVSMISNVGQTSPLASLTATGANVVAHAVTTTGAQTYNGALTIDNTLTSSVAGAITVNGALKLDADVTVTTTSGAATFNGTVDSGLINHALTVNTGGAGVTTFAGAVGSTSSLTTLTTNADGTTRIQGGTVTTSGDQTFADIIILGADTTLNGKNLIFQSSLDSDSSATPRALVLNSSSTGDTRLQGNVGSIARLLSITTNADGLTKIGASVATTAGMTFADAVNITGNATIDGGTGTLFFQKTIDADSTVTDPTLRLFASGPADADHTPFKFAASIGSTRRLGGLTLGADRATPVGATAAFSDGFNASGRVLASGVSSTDSFTITTGNGGFNMGAGQKVTAFGSLHILTTGTATIGDLSALTSISVTANSIVIRLRTGAPDLDNSLQTPNDSGTDFVTSGVIDFSVHPTTTGSGNQPTFSNDSGTADPQLIGFGFRQFPGGVTQSLFTDSRSGHTGELLTLDLQGEGPSVTSIASSIAGAIPRDTETREVATPVTVGKALRDPLQEMGVATKDLTVDDMIEFMVGRSMYRDLPLKAHPTISSGDYQVTVNRLSMSTVEAAVEAYRGLVTTPAVDEHGAPVTGPDGKAVMVNRTDLIKDTIGEAWDAYSSQAQDADGAGFRSYLESRSSSGTPAERDALAYLKGTKEVLDRLDALGLSPFEASIPKRKLIGEIKPPAMTDEQFQGAINGPKVSMR